MRGRFDVRQTARAALWRNPTLGNIFCDGGVLKRRELLGAPAVEIASVIVSALPGRREELRARMLELPGVEIHAETPDGRFVVTVEDSAHASAGDTLLKLHGLDCVLAAALVSHYEDL